MTATLTSSVSCPGKPVTNKADFVQRYAAGEFGNASPTWQCYEQWSNWYATTGRYEPARLYHIRNRVPGGVTWYDVPVLSLPRRWQQARRVYPASALYISQMAPTPKTLLQGEVQQSIKHLDLTYTTVRKPMRAALQEHTAYAGGIIASLLLRHYLCPKSCEWLMYLLNTYPDHIVEFSAYSVQWGTLPGYNTVFWEVRRY